MIIESSLESETSCERSRNSN